MTLFVYIFAIAGLSVVWKNLQDDLTWVEKGIKKFPWIVWKVLSCGFCFTFWLTLAVVLIFDPLETWAITGMSQFWHVVGSWMSLGMAAAIIRTNYVLLQAKLHYQMHINQGTEH